MDPEWRFTLGDPANAQQPGFNDRSWRRLDLPHDWSIEGSPRQDAPGGGRVGYFPTGVGWYRKAFKLPASAAADRHRAIEFDGIYMNGEVWLNGVSLGRRPYGYSSVAYDITDKVTPGENVVAVRVDNSRQPNSRWYTGSGIYRHVWLTVARSVHVGHWGTTVTTRMLDSTTASVAVRTRLENTGRLVRRGVLRLVVIAPDGQEVNRTTADFELPAGASREIEQDIDVPSAQRWSVESPALYSVRTEVVDPSRPTILVDTTRTSFGIRTVAFDKDRGFLLNGRRVKLKGVNLHHEAGALGAAVPEEVWRQRLETMKAMGVNAIRTSHNPPAPEFLDLCDRLGLLVMDEAFDEWTFGKVDEGYHKYFAEWSERDVVDFVRRDRNHPSVVLWSAGNEIGEQSSPIGVGVLQRLLDLFHREDPTRLVTTGNDQIHADGTAATTAFLNALDVVGYNYVDRWHERRELMAEEDRHAHPDWKMVGTESGSIFQSFDERYSLGDDPQVVAPNYNTAMVQAERVLKWVTTHDFFAGNFMWTGYDYLGESEWPFKGFASGMVDITGRPKDAFYLYQSQWTSQPVAHLFPHWNWPGRDGQVIPVVAYSSCNTVELFLNGRSLGEKRMEFPAQGTSGGWNSYALPQVRSTTNDLHVTWDVPYVAGTLRLVGKNRNGAVACEDAVRTAGPAAGIRLTTTHSTVTTSTGDVALVTFEVVDTAGTVVPTAEDVVHFAATGATIVAADNADLHAREREMPGQGRAYNGRGLVILRASAPGTLTLTASAPGLAEASLSIQVKPGNAPPIIRAVR